MRTTLWTSTCWPSSQARVTSVNSLSSLRSLKAEVRFVWKSFHCKHSFSSELCGIFFNYWQTDPRTCWLTGVTARRCNRKMCLSRKEWPYGGSMLGDIWELTHLAWHKKMHHLRQTWFCDKMRIHAFEETVSYLLVISTLVEGSWFSRRLSPCLLHFENEALWSTANYWLWFVLPHSQLVLSKWGIAQVGWSGLLWNTVLLSMSVIGTNWLHCWGVEGGQYSMHVHIL